MPSRYLKNDVAIRRQKKRQEKEARDAQDTLQAQARLERAFADPLEAMVQSLQHFAPAGAGKLYSAPPKIRYPNNSRHVPRPSGSRRMNMMLMFATLLLVAQGTDVAEFCLPEVNENIDEKTESTFPLIRQQGAAYESYKSHTFFSDTRREEGNRQGAEVVASPTASSPPLSIEQQFNVFEQKVNSDKDSSIIIQDCTMFIRGVLDHFTFDKMLDNSDLANDLIKDLNSAESNYSQQLIARAKKVYDVGKRAQEYEKKKAAIFKEISPEILLKEIQGNMDTITGIGPEDARAKRFLGDPKTRAEVVFRQTQEELRRDDLYSVVVGIRGAGRIEMSDTSEAILPTGFAIRWVLRKIDLEISVRLFKDKDRNNFYSPFVFHNNTMLEVWEKHMGAAFNGDFSSFTDDSNKNPRNVRMQGELMGVPEDHIEAFIKEKGSRIPKKTHIECGVPPRIFFQTFEAPKPKPPRKSVSRRGKKTPESAEPLERKPEEPAQKIQAVSPITPFCQFVHQIWEQGEKVIKNRFQPR